MVLFDIINNILVSRSFASYQQEISYFLDVFHGTILVWIRLINVYFVFGDFVKP